MRIILCLVGSLGVVGLSAVAVAAPTKSPARARAVPAPEEDSGEGFVRNAPPPPRARKVKRLTDDPGLGEEVPRGRFESTLGLAGAESIATHAGVAVGLTALARVVADLWIGGGLDYRAFAGDGRYASVSDGAVFAQARYYFMPHREANRFVMGYVLAQVGYARLAAAGGDSATRAQGLDLGLGVGVGAALSTRVYLGLQFKFRFPVWVDSCVEIGDSRACTSDPGDFGVTTWQLTLVASRLF